MEAKKQGDTQRKLKLLALKLWDNEMAIYSKADKPIENKGTYLLWREQLLLLKGMKGSLSCEVGIPLGTLWEVWESCGNENSKAVRPDGENDFEN